MSDMIEVIIDSIRVSLMSQQRIVLLRDTQSERYLAIWIGIYEAEAITLALQEVEVSRPLTWDLLKNVVQSLNARVSRVEVVSLREDTFFGVIVLEVDGRDIRIDSRPSDALALAVRTHVPIFVSRQVMETAGVSPEEDLQGRTPGQALQDAPAKPAAESESGITSEPESAEETDRLSVFEDFFDKLDLDDIDDQDDTEDKKKKD